MTGMEIGLISIIVMLLLVYAGMHVGVALTLVSVVGIWAIKGRFIIASKLLALAAADSIASHVFGVVPLFVLMGLLVSVSDMGRDAFDVANRLLGRLTAGLGVATVAANAVFAAITGISIASAAVFTKVAVPEMMRLGYRPRFAVGVVAGSSVLGMLIPPSLLLILYGILVEESVGDLFIAGILPGLVLALAFVAYILVLSRIRPGAILVPAAERPNPPKADEGRGVGARLLPILALVVLVLGGIYGGVFTPTEAGGVGALGALVLALGKRKLDARGMWRVLVETGHVTASICFLIIAANIYSRMLSLTGVPMELGQWFEQAGFGLYGFLLVYVLVTLALGTILDSSSILLIMLPLVLPMLHSLQIDLVWFGIITIIAVEVGLLTPPLGLSAYVIKSTLNDDRIGLGSIFLGALPFAGMMLLVLALVVAVPELATGLLAR